MQVIQKILEANRTLESTDFDAVLLTKLRNFYTSCLNETRLDEVGSEPLVHLVSTVRKLYTGNSTGISSVAKPDDKKKRDGLTAALAFLHSRGLFVKCVPKTSVLTHVIGIDALFSFGIEGDVGVDPNDMVLWFSQPNLGLPSKVNLCFSVTFIRDLNTMVGILR